VKGRESLAQLVKLQDYVSRYEFDVYRYPSQFVRLKKQQWEKVKHQWESGEMEEKPVVPEIAEIEKVSVKNKLFSFLKKKEEETPLPEREVYKEPEDELEFDMGIHIDIQSLEELKKVFLDQIFKFQLKWASSTILEKSYVDNSYHYDERLRYLLQRFPDNTLVFYCPILKIKNAPVELEVILLTPTDVWLLSFLEFEDGAAYIGSPERFWTKKWAEKEEKVLNPVISLKRMESLIGQILSHAEIDLPIQKGLISRNGYIDYPRAPIGIQFIDKRKHDQWFQQLRNSRSPIKGVQLKAAQALTEYCTTTSFRRVQWDDHSVVNEQDEE
jgi:hypothetical protein